MARRAAREMAAQLGFDREGVEVCALVVTELATNLMRYAANGEIVLSSVGRATRLGIEIASVDRGPGIADVGQAMQDGFSSSHGLGGGLPGIKRLMDEVELTSDPDGTRVVARKWPSER